MNTNTLERRSTIFNIEDILNGEGHIQLEKFKASPVANDLITAYRSESVKDDRGRISTRLYAKYKRKWYNVVWSEPA